MKPIQGLIAATFTAFHPNREVNYGMIAEQAKHLRKQGVTGVFINGTTGEGLLLTLEERMRIAQQWRNELTKDELLIVHAGHSCLADGKKLAEHAMRLQADAVAAVLPGFFKPSKVSDLVDYCGELAAAAPHIPFYYYHIPSLTGLSLPMADFLREAATKIPNLGGIKFTHENLMDYAKCLDMDDGKFDILFGRDEILLSGLALGAKGAVGSTYNFAAPIYLKVMEAFGRGDLVQARQEQQKATEMIAILQKFGGIEAFKSVMGMLGLDCGPVRLPLQTLPQDHVKQLENELREFGFFD